MRKKVLIGLSAVFAAAFGLSCTDDETGPWKDYDLSVTSNIASGNGNVPYEGATVVFTVTTDGRWTYVTDDSAGWLGQSAVDGNTLAVVVPENTVSKERSGQIKFISVSNVYVASACYGLFQSLTTHLLCLSILRAEVIKFY